MVSIYTLQLELDTLKAKVGALEFEKATKAAAAAAVELQTATAAATKTVATMPAATEKASRSFTDMGKSLGLTVGKLKEVGKFGAGVFAGDVLAKTFGFTNALGALSAATSLAASGIQAVSKAAFDLFLPQIKESKIRAEEYSATIEKLTARLQELRDTQAGPSTSVRMLQPGDRTFPGNRLGEFQSRVSLRGLGESQERQAIEAILDTQQKLDELYSKLQSTKVTRGGGAADFSRLSYENPKDQKFIRDAYTDVVNSLDEQIARLRIATIEEKNRADALKQQTAELARQKNYTVEIAQQEQFGTFAPPTYQGNAVQFGPEYIEQQQSPYFDPPTGGSAGGFGQNDYEHGKYRGYGRKKGNGLGFDAQGIIAQAQAMATLGQNTLRAAAATEKLLQEQERIAATSRDIGFAFGNAFEGFILGAQSASEAVRNLGLQIIQSLLNLAVTQPIQNFFGQMAFGALGGVGSLGNTGGGGSLGGAGHWGGGGGGGSGQAPLQAGGGSQGIHIADGGFRLSRRQIAESRGRGRV